MEHEPNLISLIWQLLKASPELWGALFVLWLLSLAVTPVWLWAAELYRRYRPPPTP